MTKPVDQFDSNGKCLFLKIECKVFRDLQSPRSLVKPKLTLTGHETTTESPLNENL